MRPHHQTRLATLVMACLFATALASCSQPIDPQSSVPAVYQPLVFVAAAVGVGILITSHNHKSSSSNSGSPQPVPTTAAFVGAFPSLVHPYDLSLDFSTGGSGGVGALGTETVGYGFSEFGSAGTDNGTYKLPVGYKPRALAIDGNGNDWFVDSTGLVRLCPAATATPTTCTPTLSFSDGLPAAGTRTIAADSARVFIAQDNQAGTVSWTAYALDGTGKVTGSYTYTGSSMYNDDAAQATIGAIGIYTIFHKDGSSWVVALPNSTQNTYKFNPAPVASTNMASDGLGNDYGVLGAATSGDYELGHYVSTGNSSATPGTLASTVIIAFNGQSSTSTAPFFPPVFSLHTDDSFIFMLDSSGQLVLFTVF